MYDTVKIGREEVSDQKSEKYSGIGNIVWATKRLWRLDKRLLLLAFASAPVDVAIPLAGTYFTKILIDRLGEGAAFGRLCVLCLGFTLTQILLTGLSYLLTERCFARRYYATGICQSEMEETVNCQTDYENIERQDFKKILGYARGDSGNGNCSMEFIWQDLTGLFKDLLGIVTYASLIMALDPVIFAVVAVTSVMAYFTTRWEPVYHRRNKHKWEKEERKNRYLEGLSAKFQAAKDIKLYGLEGWLEGMMRDYHAYLLAWDKRCSLRGLWGAAFAGVMTLLQNGTAYMVLIGLLLKGGITVGDFVFCFGITGAIAGFLRRIIEDVANLSTRADKIAYFRELFDYPCRYNHGQGCGLPAAPVKIEFKDVWYKYDGAKDYTLKGITMTLEAGGSLALVGVNGAGKTTLIKLLSGFLDPDQGAVLLSGVDIREYDRSDYYRLFSAVFQDFSVLGGSVAENVAQNTSPDREKVWSCLGQAGIRERIERLPGGLDAKLEKKVYPEAVELSGGEIQRLMMARMLYKDAPMILLDEPTAALDALAEQDIYERYNELTQGRTSVYISHRLASTRFCDRVILLEDGGIREEGTHEELLALEGRYAELFRVQSKYYREDTDEDGQDGTGGEKYGQ